jgi:hypothetical protein
VIRLSKGGVPEAVIEAMRNPKAAPPRPAASPSASPAAATAVSLPSTSTPAPAPAETAPAPAAVPAPRSEVALTLSDGLAFSLSLAEDIPQNAEEGRPLRFTVAKDVRVGDVVVIAKGAAVSGTIAQTGRKLFGGSKMTLRLLTVDAVDGQKCRIRAQSGRTSDGKNERSVETNVKPKNKDLVAAAGTEYIAYIDGDVTLSVKK